ncbi:hypothetical protein V1508DRAFT_407018 [Lipomyces doorenjongii]|uniref:uncharacterized protein n=1 Tax=Lipomyces doorenjongii TaxID=383834 RepID=UPI0034CE3AF2
MVDILKSVYVSSTMQATLFSAISYILGRAVLALRDSNGFRMNIDYSALVRLISWSAIITPVGLLWQEKLDKSFPSTNPKTDTSDQYNIFIKVVLSETLFSIFVNSAFIAYITYLDKGDWKFTMAKVRNDVPKLWISSVKVWPLVTYISFGFIPPQLRVTFTSIVGLLWGIYVNAFVIGK